MRKRFAVVTPAEAGRQPENYVLGLDLEDASVTRPALTAGPGFGGVDEFAGPFQPAWGWEVKVAPDQGVSPEETLRDLRMNPAERTFNMVQDARQAVALGAFGRMDATSVDLASPERGTWIAYQPETYVGEPPISDVDWPGSRR